MEKRNSPYFKPLVKVVTRTLSFASLIKRATLLKWITYDLRLSSSHCLMFSMAAEDLLCLCPPMKCVTKCPLNSLKVETMFGVSLLNHTLAGPFSVVDNALHIISSRTPCRCMRVVNDSRWSCRSLNPSYASTCGIWYFVGRGKEVTWLVNGEFVRCTNLSRLVYTCPLRAFIIISIFSFIIYMPWAMCLALTSTSDGRLVSSVPSVLLRMLLSSWSSLPCLSPFGR